MSHYYLDASAIAKRYLPQIGTAWVRGLSDPASGHTIAIAAITRVEVASALAARHRATGGLSLRERDRAVSLLLRHCATEYQIVALTATVLDEAVRLTQQYRLRGYDAVQLAAALLANAALVAAGLPALVMIAADSDLLTAARGEGLDADDPNRHP